MWPFIGLGFTLWLGLGYQAISGTPSLCPGRASHDVGVIFLPGGLVEPRAYGPLLQPLADNGYPVELVELPWRCACTDAQRAELFDRIETIVKSRARVRWTLAGHSRGAMLAARYVQEKRKRPAALVLMGTTHPRDFSLAQYASFQMLTVKINATEDGVAPLKKSQENRHLLPADADWREIEGGNHSHYGHYRWQLFDGAARIPREAQQAAVRGILLGVFARVREMRLGQPVVIH